MRVIFLGTPDFGVPALDALNANFEVVAVVCQPDRVVSRGKIEYCAVKKYALAHNISVYQFEKVSRDGVETLKNLRPDIMVTAAYGQILSQEVIDIAPHGILNIHGSLLPELRGAAPIQYAVMQGLAKTGITILKTVKAVDAGDMLLQRELDILPYETNGELFARLSRLGAECIVQALREVADGTAKFTPQDESKATFCHKIPAEAEHIDWNMPAEQLINLVRALSPAPAAWTSYEGKRIKIYALRPAENTYPQAAPGTIVECGKKVLAVACADGAVKITELQKENGKRMDVVAFLCGTKLPAGSKFDL